jgi:hypothetical protein
VGGEVLDALGVASVDEQRQNSTCSVPLWAMKVATLRSCNYFAVIVPFSSSVRQTPRTSELEAAFA